MTRKTRLAAKVKPYAEILEAIADIRRLSIAYTLAQRPMDVREIIDVTGFSGPLMTHHLNILYKTGWVTKRKYGKRVEYTLMLKNKNIIEDLLKDSPIWKENLS